jgi:hypothetical protein
MAITRKNAKDSQSLRIERIFQNSRLANELMASAYEKIIPIRRKTLNVTKKAYLPHKSWSRNKEKRKCVIGMRKF